MFVASSSSSRLFCRPRALSYRRVSSVVVVAKIPFSSYLSSGGRRRRLSRRKTERNNDSPPFVDCCFRLVDADRMVVLFSSASRSFVLFLSSSSSRHAKSHLDRIFPLAVVVVVFRGEKPSETMIPRRLLIVAFVSSTRIEWWCYFRRRRVPSCCFCRRRRRVAIVWWCSSLTLANVVLSRDGWWYHGWLLHYSIEHEKSVLGWSGFVEEYSIG